MSLLSKTNGKLISITHALAAIKLGQKIAIFIPGAQGAVIASKATEVTLRTLSESLARYQDLQIQFEKLNEIAILQCGIPTIDLFESSPKFSRQETPESRLTNSPAPLEWTNPEWGGYLEIRSRALEFLSFGQCEKSNPNFLKTLRGENFIVTLHRPVIEDKSQPKWFSSLQSARSLSSFF